MNYKLTPYEQSIKDLYRSIGIMNPEKIDMMKIAEKLDIWLYFHDIHSHIIQRKGVYSLIIDKRLSNKMQWQDFGHELCHILHHSGNQLYMPESLIEFQESKADNFMYHFCVPTFMLTEMQLPNERVTAIAVIADTFNVTYAFAEHRLDMFLRNLQQYEFDQQIKTLMNRNYNSKKSDSKVVQYNSSKWSDETKSIMKKLYQQIEKKKVMS